MNTPSKTKLILSVAFLLVALTACGGGSAGTSSSGTVASAGGTGGLTPLIQDDGNRNGGGNSTLLPVNICNPGHQQLLNLNISDIYMLDSNNVRLPWTAAELSAQQTGTITVGSQTHNISWLKVSLNQLFFPTSPLGSEFTRISYDITKVDPKYNVWSQSTPSGSLRFSFLEDVIASPSSFQTITSVGSAGGLQLINNQTDYARLPDNQSFPLHAFSNLTPVLNWVSTQTTRKIVVVQVCEGNFEDSTAAIDPALGYRPLIKASSNPILIELNEEVAPALQ